MVTHLAIRLAHIFQPDELIDQQRHDLVGQLAAMLFEIAGDGLRQLFAGGRLAAERVQMLDDGSEFLGMRTPRARHVRCVFDAFRRGNRRARRDLFRDLGYRLDAFAGAAFCVQVFDQRIEVGVPGDDVNDRVRLLLQQ